MGALPNESPRPAREPKKRTPLQSPTSPLEPRELPRDRAAIEADFRFGKGTSGDPGGAWAPQYREFVAARYRLTSGGTFYGVTDYIVQQCARKRKQGTPFSWEAEINVPELAVLLEVNERSINRELLYMQQRDMAIVARLAGGRAVARIVFESEAIGDKLFPGWANISESYKAWAAAQRKTLDEQAEELEAEAENPADREAIYVKIKPQSVKRGKGSKSKIDAFVKSMRVECDEKSPVDINISGEVVSGELVLSVCGNDTKTYRSTQVANPVKSTTSQETSGRICPNGQKFPPNEGSQKYPHTRVEKRGPELAALFDPLCKLSNSKILSGDPAALRAACDAAGDIPRAALTKFVLERSERAISGPRACLAIVKEAVANWQSGGVGTVATDTTRGTGDERAKQIIAGLKTLNEMRRRRRE